jgi:hypothetical protein
MPDTPACCAERFFRERFPSLALTDNTPITLPRRQLLLVITEALAWDRKRAACKAREHERAPY